MGLFDKLRGTEGQLNAAEGFAGIALAAVAADGVLTEEEAQSLGATLSRMKLFRAMNPREFNAVFEKVVKRARSKGVDTLLAESSAAIPKDLRATAFAISTDLVLADGEVSDDELKFLERIAKSLEVPEAEAERIVEVLQIKNRG
ncbi:MAG TPA: tellurite resistance TerB family protein [Candidatus Thermoplasmatota archaeon]|nr:tellurite resistance TerB family protein [Candidatus Thermoplasmatota archaeon]